MCGSFSSFMAKHDRGENGKPLVNSINIGDVVYNRYNGYGVVTEESDNCYYVDFEGKTRLFRKETATKYLHEA